MRTSVVMWGAGGIAILLGAACSGTDLHEVGELNNAGSGDAAGSSTVGPSGGGSVGTAGSKSTGQGGALGTAGSFAPGGGEGIVDPPGDTAGAAGQGGGDVLACPACQLVASGEDVRSIATDAENVFWVDYGTNDSFGNYRRDGRLFERGLTGGTTSVLADSLAGPWLVSVSSQYVYVFVNQRTEADHPYGVGRVSLAGGVLQPLQSLPVPTIGSGGLAVSAFALGYEYWAWDGTVYRIADTDGASVETFVAARGIGQIWADDTLLYFVDPVGLWTTPLTGGDPTKLSSDPVALNAQLLQGDYLYAEETPAHPVGAGIYLSRMPKAGGAWTRVAVAGNDLIWSQVAVDGDRYFIDEPTATERRILQRSLTTPTSVITLASEAYAGNDSWAFQTWALSSVGVFLADSTGLYLTRIAAP